MRVGAGATVVVRLRVGVGNEGGRVRGRVRSRILRHLTSVPVERWTAASDTIVALGATTLVDVCPVGIVEALRGARLVVSSVETSECRVVVDVLRVRGDDPRVAIEFMVVFAVDKHIVVSLSVCVVSCAWCIADATC